MVKLVILDPEFLKLFFFEVASPGAIIKGNKKEDRITFKEKIRIKSILKISSLNATPSPLSIVN